MKTNLFALSCCFLTVLCVCQFAFSGMVFESSTGVAGSSGAALGDYSFAMHRFELKSQTRVGSIGGYFACSLPETTSIFGAIVMLTRQYDLPDSIDLSTSDVLATTLIDIERTPDDYYGKIDMVLKPGWYAAAFGTGKFGATSVPDIFRSACPRMYHLSVDLSPQKDFVMMQPDHPYHPNKYSRVSQNYPARFLVTTEIIPEPASMLLLGIGAMVLKRRRHNI